MQIYNRWGNRIIYTTDNSWNGMKQANSLEIGVYVYFIKFDVWENGKLNNIKQKGNVTLIR